MRWLNWLTLPGVLMAAISIEASKDLAQLSGISHMRQQRWPQNLASSSTGLPPMNAKNLISWPAIALAALLSIALAIFGYRDAAQTTALAEHGKRVVAQIEEVNWTTKRGVDRNFQLKVAFETASGVMHQTVDVDKELGERARDDEGFDELDVVYLPEDTSTVRVVDDPGMATGLYIISALAAALAGILAFLRLRKRD